MTISAESLAGLIAAVRGDAQQELSEVTAVLLSALAELAAQLHRQGSLDIAAYRQALALQAAAVPAEMGRMRLAYAELSVLLDSAAGPLAAAGTAPPG